MKKPTLIILLAGFLICTLVLCLTLNDNKNPNEPTNTTAPAQTPTTPGGTLITSKSLTINGTDISGNLAHAVDVFNFSQDILVSKGASWILSLDIYGMEVVTTKTVALAEGKNEFYIHITLPDQSVQTYTANLYRNHMYTVSFDPLGGTSVSRQYVEEGKLATEPTTSREGYTFQYWDYDFSNPITCNTTVIANWTANTDTPYRVEHYLQNLEDDNYPIVPNYTDYLTATTDTHIQVEPKEFNHFYLDTSNSNLSENVYADGSLVLKVYYKKNTYKLSNANTTYGSITNSATYNYSEMAETTATAFPGCDFLGWYSEDILLSTDTTFTFTAEHDVEARFTVKEELSPFNFAITSTSCTITGIKDKTIQEIIIPDCVTSIGEYAFEGCDSLTSVVIGNSVTSIGAGAFYECSSLTSVAIPNSVTSIGTVAFVRCNSLTRVYISDLSAWCNITFDTNTANPLHLAKNLYLNDELVTALVIPDSVTSIGDSAFSGCSSLSSVAIGDSVTSIGRWAFDGCDSLTSVVIPDSVENIGNGSFANCDSLTSVVIPDSVTSIGNFAFSGCSSLTRVVIPDSVTSIGEYAFDGCDSLTSVVIPDSVTSIGEWAFFGCENLKNIYYRGTSSQWKAISKGSKWDQYWLFTSYDVTYARIPYTITYNYTGN